MSNMLHASPVPAAAPAAVTVQPPGVTSAFAHVTLDDLSQREVDVLRLITLGFSNQEIAEELYVTGNTVKSFIRSAYRKLGVTRRSQAVIWGFQHGLLESGDVA
jgi:DNA-binding NarL/FixJ family response regulator